MASRLAKAIQDTCVKPEVEKRRSQVIARVIKSYSNMKAKIQYTNVRSGGIIELDNVSVCLEARGFSGTTLLEGDLVLVSFFGDYGNLPTITRLLDPDFETKTKMMSKHDRKGAFLPDFLCTR